MAKVHFVLQGKGGVGKSVVAALLAQYLVSKGDKPLCIDTDPINATFSGYGALKVKRIDIMEGDDINTRSFDTLVQLVYDSKADAIVDNGASSFVPLSSYLISNDVPALLLAKGHQVVIHTVVTGGQALRDTVNGFTQLVAQYPNECSFVVWLNPFWGAVEMDGKKFEEFKSYIDHRPRISALVTIPDLKKDTFGFDLAEILKARITFSEALADGTRNVMQKQRLGIIRDRLFDQLKSIPVFA